MGGWNGVGSVRVSTEMQGCSGGREKRKLSSNSKLEKVENMRGN